MDKVWAVTWKDLQVAFAGWQRWLRMFLLPAVAIYLIGLGTQELARGFTPTIIMDVWDADHSLASQAFLDEVSRGHDAVRVALAEGEVSLHRGHGHSSLMMGRGRGTWARTATRSSLRTSGRSAR